MARIYLDNNATTAPLPEVREAVARALLDAGNPSSSHASGRAARAMLSDAREAVAALLGADPRDVVFTSGGTEADNLAVLGGARAAAAAGAPRRAVASAVEHPAVEEALERLAGEGFEVVRAAVDGDGLPDPAAVAAAASPGASLVALILAQNETGGILPVREAFAAARERAPLARLHVDAVQAFGKLPFSPASLGADTVAVSAHKIHGPKGIGALWVRPGREPIPRALGGKQERGLRTGTENVPGAAGFGAAARAALRDGTERAARAARLGALLEEGALRIPGARRNGPSLPRRLPGTLNVSFDGVRGDLLLLALDAEGIEVSTGSACASGAPTPSRVLLALGLGADRARGAVRLSAGALTTEDEVRAAIAALDAAVRRLADGARSAIPPGFREPIAVKPA
jgi:cysteine desulfurase